MACFAVFVAKHQLVRRGAGVLLRGWFRFATVEDAGQLWREDLATGDRVALGSAARVECVDADVEAVVLDASREGRNDAVAELRARHATRAITAERTGIPIPGTRNVMEFRSDRLRII